MMHALARQQPGTAILLQLIADHGDGIDADIEACTPQPAVVGQEIPFLGEYEIGELP